MVALCKLVFLFQAVAIRFNAKFGHPGTGILTLILCEVPVTLAFEDLFCTENILEPRGSMNFLDFYAITTDL